MEEVISATIVEFVDGEEGFEATVWDDTPNRLAVYHKLNNAYHWFKWQRPALEIKEDQCLDDSLLCLRYAVEPWAEYRASLYIDFAAKKETLDNFHFQNIIKYRKHLWT